jgi:hypothetical protein
MRWNSSNARNMSAASVNRKLLYSLLALASIGMLLLLSGFAAWQLRLLAVAGLLYTVAERMLLTAFAGWAVWGLLALLRGFLRDVGEFLSGENRAMRRFWFKHQRQQSQQIRQHEQTRQLHYRFHFKRQKLQQADARRQRRLLLRALQRELRQARNQFDLEEYNRLRRALILSYRHADDAALLALRERFACR